MLSYPFFMVFANIRKFPPIDGRKKSREKTSGLSRSSLESFRMPSCWLTVRIPAF